MPYLKLSRCLSRKSCSLDGCHYDYSWLSTKGVESFGLSPGFRHHAEHTGLILPCHFSLVWCLNTLAGPQWKLTHCYYYNYYYYYKMLRLPSDERHGCHHQEQTEFIVWEALHNFHWSSRNLPSLLGFPRTFLTSALVGFVPRARRTSPTWLKVILHSPVLSNRRNASLNSARSTRHSGPGENWLSFSWNLLINPRFFKLFSASPFLPTTQVISGFQTITGVSNPLVFLWGTVLKQPF